MDNEVQIKNLNRFETIAETAIESINEIEYSKDVKGFKDSISEIEETRCIAKNKKREL